jgi:hypothetical protein
VTFRASFHPKEEKIVYDLAVVLPCHLQDKYLDRIYDFRKYGLLNIGDKKVKVFLLVGSNAIPEELRSGWRYEVEFVSSKGSFDGPKVYDFVLGLSSEDVKKYRWWLKLDDDSATDVVSQVNRMDEEFDWERPEYVFGDHRGGVERIFEEAIKKTKHKNRFLGPNSREKQIFFHEFNSSVMSSPCMQRIIEDEECRKFLGMLTAPENNVKQCWHDQGLAVAARFVKIHGCICPFMTCLPLVDDFSLFGGRFTYIHWIHRLSKEWPHFESKLLKALC